MIPYLRVGASICFLIIILALAPATPPIAWGGGPGAVSISRARKEVAKITEAMTEELTQGCNKFAFELYLRTAAKRDQGENFVVAPYGVAESLGLIYAGAKGDTADEIAKVLHVSLTPAQIGPAFASLKLGGGSGLLEEAGAAHYRLGVRVRNTDGKKGVEITEVKKDSPAWNAGLRPKDRIIRLGDEDISDTVKYANVLDRYVTGLEGEIQNAQGSRRFTAQLNIPKVGQTRVRPLIATGLWGNKGSDFQPAFKETAALYFGAAAESVDFRGAPMKASAHIDHWVAETTDDNIRAFLPRNSIDAKASLVLTNAIYFEAGWRARFNPNDTELSPFSAPDKKRKVHMMYKNARFRFGRGSAADIPFEVLELELEGNFAIAFFLPEKDLSIFEEKLFTLKQVSTWFGQLKETQTNVSIPRFRVAAETSLEPTLKRVGVHAAFGDSADLSGMFAKAIGPISSVLHNAEVEIDEKGVRAQSSGKTGGLVVPTPNAFTANRPFLFTIRDTHSGVILFMGRIMSPEL